MPHTSTGVQPVLTPHPCQADPLALGGGGGVVEGGGGRLGGGLSVAETQ